METKIWNRNEIEPQPVCIKHVVSWQLQGSKKKFEFQLVFWASSSHILVVRGHFFLNLRNDLDRCGSKPCSLHCFLKQETLLPLNSLHLAVYIQMGPRDILLKITLQRTSPWKRQLEFIPAICQSFPLTCHKARWTLAPIRAVSMERDACILNWQNVFLWITFPPFLERGLERIDT